MSRMLAWTLLTLTCGLLFFQGLAAGPLYKTEGLRALVAAEMLREHHWLVPTLCGEPLLTKPPLGYLAIVLASLPVGSVQPWTARLPSAMAASIAVLLFYNLFQRPLGRSAGIVAALTLPATVLWLDRVPSADLDMLQLAWVAGSLFCLHQALEDAESPSPSGQYGWWSLALLCVAGGVLTKWTAPAFFYLTAVPLLWWRGQLKLLWRAPHLLAATLGATICLGWAGAVVADIGWPTFRDTVGREALTKLVPGHRSMPYPWHEVALHPLTLLAAELPWSAIAIITFWPGFARLLDEPGRRLLQLLHCWAWPNLLFWSIVPVHTARHSLPLVPALAGLSALVWIAWLRGNLRWPLPLGIGERRGVSPTWEPTCVPTSGLRLDARLFCDCATQWRAPHWTLACLLGLWVGVKLVFVHAIVPERNGARHPADKASQLTALLPPGVPLYVYRLKDECLLFYTDRVLRRLDLPEGLQDTPELLYCILTEAEWQGWPRTRPADVVGRLADTQNTPLVLVRVPSVSNENPR